MGSIQVETIQEELNRDVNEDKQKQIEEMKRKKPWIFQSPRGRERGL